MEIKSLLRQKKVLVAAHRGSCGGNIPCNSRQSFTVALRQGADIVELDVENTKDGKLYIQHPGMEKMHLRMKDSIRMYPESVVREFYLSNCDGDPTDQHILSLRDALLLLKGKCIVNIDKFWRNPEKISALVRELHMENEVLIKCSTKPDYLADVEKYAPDLPFMAVIKGEDTVSEALKDRNINYVGAEVIFADDADAVASPEYIKKMHADGKFLFVNAEVYDYRAVLSGGHNDDISMVESEEKGWGWLADRGFDIIQTDFLLSCRQFLEQTGRREK